MAHDNVKIFTTATTTSIEKTTSGNLDDYCCYCNCADCQLITQHHPSKDLKNCPHCNLLVSYTSNTNDEKKKFIEKQRGGRGDYNSRKEMLNHEAATSSNNSTICGGGMAAALAAAGAANGQTIEDQIKYVDRIIKVCLKKIIY